MIEREKKLQLYQVFLRVRFLHCTLFMRCTMDMQYIQRNGNNQRELWQIKSFYKIGNIEFMISMERCVSCIKAVYNFFCQFLVSAHIDLVYRFMAIFMNEYIRLKYIICQGALKKTLKIVKSSKFSEKIQQENVL